MGNAAARETAVALVEAAIVYGWIGLAVAVAFLVVGVDRIDQSARGSYAFRPVVAPGVIVLWPLVLWLWLAKERALRSDAASEEAAE